MSDRSDHRPLFAPDPGRHVPLSPTAEEPCDEEHPSRAYACVRGQRDSAAVLELRFLHPNTPDQALEYSLRRRTLWDKAGGAIVLEFVDGLRATIRGIGLSELKERLLRRVVTWVQEQGTDRVRMAEAERTARARGDQLVWVTAIEVIGPDEPG